MTDKNSSSDNEDNGDVPAGWGRVGRLGVEIEVLGAVGTSVSPAWAKVDDLVEQQADVVLVAVALRPRDFLTVLGRGPVVYIFH